jgi:hypothetical protein
MGNKELLRKEWKRIVSMYSSEELVEKSPEDYEGLFLELSKGDNLLEELANLYSDTIFISNYSFLKTNDYLNLPPILNLEDIKKEICALISNCISESPRLCLDGVLEKEDFLIIEKIIDKVPFEKMGLMEEAKFEEKYKKFKDTALEVFLGEKFLDYNKETLYMED